MGTIVHEVAVMKERRKLWFTMSVALDLEVCWNSDSSLWWVRDLGRGGPYAPAGLALSMAAMGRPFPGLSSVSAFRTATREGFPTPRALLGPSSSKP